MIEGFPVLCAVGSSSELIIQCSGLDPDGAGTTSAVKGDCQALLLVVAEPCLGLALPSLFLHAKLYGEDLVLSDFG